MIYSVVQWLFSNMSTTTSRAVGYKVDCVSARMLRPYFCDFLSRSAWTTSLLPVCGLSESASAAVMFILSATPPPPCTETWDTQALLGTFGRGWRELSWRASYHRLTLTLKYIVFLWPLSPLTLSGNIGIDAFCIKHLQLSVLFLSFKACVMSCADRLSVNHVIALIVCNVVMQSFSVTYLALVGCMFLCMWKTELHFLMSLCTAWNCNCELLCVSPVFLAVA